MAGTCRRGRQMIREFHLFAGIGGGIYAGELLGHRCCAGVEIMEYAQRVLRQRQADGWLPEFPIYPDLCKLHGQKFRGTFDVLCGGFPCQAFSSAAHGKNIAEKNLWDEMLRFTKESDAPIVFCENVVMRAIKKAQDDLEAVGYKVERIRLGNSDLGADHRRYRFWLLAVKDETAFTKLAAHVKTLPKLAGSRWECSPEDAGKSIDLVEADKCLQLTGIGNAQSPLVAASAFRILVNRHLSSAPNRGVVATTAEISAVFEKRITWIQRRFNGSIGLVHTPTTIANYCCESMQKHLSCRNYVEVFHRNRGSATGTVRPCSTDAEYLMGFPIGASFPHPLDRTNIQLWKETVNVAR